MIILFMLGLVSCKRTTFEGQSVSVAKVLEDEKFCIHLPEDHSKGINWQLDENYNTSLLYYTGSVWEGNERGVSFMFKATRKGETKLLLKERTYNEFTDSVFVTVVVE